MPESPNDLKNVDLSKSQHDQTTYLGRIKHFTAATNPLNLTLTSKELEFCKKVVTAQNRGKLEDELDSETYQKLTVKDLYLYKNQYDSAYHPTTGELQPWWGRMSSQVPMNMVITGAMVALSHTQFLNIFWQLANQTYNAAVNYTNRSGGDAAGVQNLALAWGCASFSAVGASFQAQKMINNNATLQKMNPAILRSLGPFAGIVAANLINIPVMRNEEFTKGIAVTTESGETLGHSTELTYPAIGKVVFGRLCIAFCCVICPSMMMKSISAIRPVKKLLQHKSLGRPTDVTLTILSVGVCLALAVPPALAIFPQRVEVEVERLPEELKKKVRSKYPEMKSVFYNKGL